MNLICKCLGGSHMYGLNTPESDMDYRGVFLNDNISTVIGIDKHNVIDIKKESTDVLYMELRHFINSLRKTNSQPLELLFNDVWLEEPNKLFKYIQKNRNRLIDSVKFYASLKGFIKGEIRLALGERKGEVGGKRHAAIEKWGFSPKNFQNIMRLCYSGTVFFNTGIYPINITHSSVGFANELLRVRKQTEEYTATQLYDRCIELESKLDHAFDNRQKTYEFDLGFANDLILMGYFDLIKNRMDELVI